MGGGELGIEGTSHWISVQRTGRVLVGEAPSERAHIEAAVNGSGLALSH